MWGTTIRPLALAPDVIASFAVFDQSHVRAALFNGTQLPGGGPWNNGASVMAPAVPSLIATFNGGFQFKDIEGGYFTEGRVVKPLTAGQATLAIRADGELSIGVYGVDLTNDGSWVSLRQNLPMIVDGAASVVESAHGPGGGRIYWGDNFGHVVLDLRSALCLRTDGSMMYAVVGKVDIDGLAAVLVDAGCRRAMELDINGRWPQFVTFPRSGPNPPTPVALDGRMSRLDRTVGAGSTKDFIALFDPSTLPAGVVR